jgi:uncharacterized repeat protein (TIGR03803 family)
MKAANLSARLRRSIKLAGAALCVAAAYSSCDAWAGTLTVLQSFGQTSANGYIPQNIAVGSDGTIYGATEGGGAHNQGAVYRLTLKNGKWTEDVLYSFGSHKDDGNSPNGIVVTSDGAIFGTTQSGGKFTDGGCSSAGCGTVFEVVSNDSGTTWKESILHSFKGFPTDGSTPRAGLLADSKDSVNGFPTFYGTTTLGGAGHDQTICGDDGCGTLYELTREKSGWRLQILQSLNGKDGFSPESAPTLGKDGDLFFSTPLGGTTGNARSENQGDGIDKDLSFAKGVSDIYAFDRSFGFSPASSPDELLKSPVLNGDWSSNAADKKNTFVIGTAYGGGAVNSCTSNGAIGCGTVYLLTSKSNPKAMWSAKVVHKFAGGADGAGPTAGLTLDTKTGVYYGVTSGEESPSSDQGTIFALTPSKTSSTGYDYSRLFRFTGKNGAYPRSNLVIDNGVLYGTTGGGGKYAFGTVFSFKP